MPTRQQRQILKRPIGHIDIAANSAARIIESYKKMRGSAGDLADATNTYIEMLLDPNCTVFLSLAGSASAQGLMNIWPALVRNRMVDVVLATGASLIDMDLFETLGFNHWHGSPNVDNARFGNLHIDRIYDTNISEDDLLQVDAFNEEFLETLEERSYSPREILWQLGRFLSENPGRVKKEGGLIQTCFEEGVPIFCLGLTDSAFGMGSSYHQMRRSLKRSKSARGYVRIDTTPEYTDLAKIKLVSRATGLVMIGGGIPKNHVQDTVIVAQGLLALLRDENQKALLERMGYSMKPKKDEVPLHRYAIQITVADPRDGACSSSTLEEARTWGKVDLANQKMVFAEATMAVPLMAAAAYDGYDWRTERSSKNYGRWLASLKEPRDFGKIPSR